MQVDPYTEDVQHLNVGIYDRRSVHSIGWWDLQQTRCYWPQSQQVRPHPQCSWGASIELGPFVSTFASKLTEATPPSYGNLIEWFHSKEYWHNNHREDHEILFIDYYQATISEGYLMAVVGCSYGGCSYSHLGYYIQNPPSSDQKNSFPQGGYSKSYNRGRNCRHNGSQQYNPCASLDPSRYIRHLDAQIA